MQAEENNNNIEENMTEENDDFEELTDQEAFEIVYSTLGQLTEISYEETQPIVFDEQSKYEALSDYNDLYTAEENLDQVENIVKIFEGKIKKIVSETEREKIAKFYLDEFIFGYGQSHSTYLDNHFIDIQFQITEQEKEYFQVSYAKIFTPESPVSSENPIVITLDFLNQDGQWKLDDFTMEGKSLELTKDDAIKYFKEYYYKDMNDLDEGHLESIMEKQNDDYIIEEIEINGQIYFIDGMRGNLDYSDSTEDDLEASVAALNANGTFDFLDQLDFINGLIDADSQIVSQSFKDLIESGAIFPVEVYEETNNDDNKDNDFENNTEEEEGDSDGTDYSESPYDGMEIDTSGLSSKADFTTLLEEIDAHQDQETGAASTRHMQLERWEKTDEWDAVLNAVYQILMADHPQADTIQDEQIKWLAETEQEANDIYAESVDFGTSMYISSANFKLEAFRDRTYELVDYLD